MDKQHINLIIVDVIMDEMDGYKLTEHLLNCDNMSIQIFMNKQL